MKLLKELNCQAAPGQFKTLSSLNESSLIRSTAHISTFSGRDIADLTCLTMMSLHVLVQEPQHAEWATNYASRTLQWGNFVRFSSALTDLYVLIHMLEGHHRDHLKDPMGTANLFHHMFVDMRALKTHLRIFANGTSNLSANKRFLLQLENQLRITDSNYKSCRRLIDDWNQIDSKDQRLTVSRLLQAFRTRAPRSDILPQLEALASEKNLEQRQRHSQALDRVDKKMLILRALELQAQLNVPLAVAGAMAKKELSR